MSSFPYWQLAKAISAKRGASATHLVYGHVLWYATACEGQGGFARDDPRVAAAGRYLSRDEKNAVRDAVRQEWERRKIATSADSSFLS